MRYVFSIIFLLLAYISFSQEHAFVIMNVKGSATINNNGKTTPAKIGQWIAGTEQIKVADKSEVTLICKTQGYILLNKAGTYQPTDYKDKCQPSKTNILNNYMKFCWDEFSHEEGGTGAEHQKHMEVVGAAVRGRSKCYAIIDSLLMVVNYCTGNLELSWQKNAPEPLHFKVYEYPDGGNTIIDVAVTSNSYPMIKLTGVLKKGVDYFWTLVPVGKEEECQRNHLQIWEKADYDLLFKSYEKEVSLITTDNASKAYMLGYLLEGMHFYAEALSYYNKATQLAPGNTNYSYAAKKLKNRISPPVSNK